jgi:RNA recognition motif-containing protein
MADDLDDFFNDVEDAEAKVTKDEKGEDALDDFFNDLKEAQQKQKEDEEPPAKKIKLIPPVRPRGVVVAASSSVVLPKKSQEADQPVEETGGGSSAIPNAPANVAMPTNPPLPPGPVPNNSNNVKKSFKRMAGGKVWEDLSLKDWPDNDYRIFCGNLDPTTQDVHLAEHFKKYESVVRAKVVKDASGSSKGYGFVSFLSPLCCAKAIREMDQSWLGARPIRVKRSDWKDRNASHVRKKSKQRKKRGY